MCAAQWLQRCGDASTTFSSTNGSTGGARHELGDRVLEILQNPSGSFDKSKPPCLDPNFLHTQLVVLAQFRWPALRLWREPWQPSINGLESIPSALSINAMLLNFESDILLEIGDGSENPNRMTPAYFARTHTINQP